MPKCDCKEYNKVNPHAESFHIVYTEDKSETPIHCPICDDRIRFQLPTYIPQKQVRMYTQEILEKLKNAKV